MGDHVRTFGRSEGIAKIKKLFCSDTIRRKETGGTSRTLPLGLHPFRSCFGLPTLCRTTANKIKKDPGEKPRVFFLFLA
jgi:hypothetical protein